MQITPHFSLAELTRTSTGKPNTPTAEHLAALGLLCGAVLERWRKRVGPLKVNSGYRSPAVNEAVGGSSRSQHSKGEAADVEALGMPRRQAWGILLEMMAEDNLPVDQAIIYEATNHIHVSCTDRRAARKEVLVKTGAGYVHWYAYDGKDTIK